MLRILVVDDDQTTLETYHAVLRQEGYAVGLANSCATAIQSLSQRGAPHAMFLDLNLRRESGFDILRWMRVNQLFVPTAVMTAFRMTFDPDEAFELGALAYVDQPLSVETLISVSRSLTRSMSPLDDPNELHDRVRAGDPGALECLDGAFWRELPKRLARAFPRAPSDFVEDAVSAACVEYGGGAVHRFHPDAGGSVLDFVYAIAWRNLRDQLQSEYFRADRQRRWAREQPVTVEPTFEVPALDVWPAILAITKDPAERRAADAWLDGLNNDAIAAALGCADLDAPARRRAAKQFKDRMIKRLSRYLR